MTTAAQSAGLPWAPEDLPIPTTVLLDHWHYAVLEEIVDGAALFRRWSWPRVDQLGHLFWTIADEQSTYAATIGIDDLRVQVYEANGIQRAPRCGDTFAITARLTDVWRRGRHASSARSLLGDWAYDISADAREAAKLSYQGSLAPVHPRGEVDDAEQAQQSAALDRRRREPLQRLEILGSPERDVHHRGRTS